MRRPILSGRYQGAFAENQYPKVTPYNLVCPRRIPFIKRGRSLPFDVDEVIRSIPHYAKSEEAGLRDNEWRAIRGA